MSESDVKQVTVALSHPDELNPRRRRRTRKFKDDTELEPQAGGAAPVDVQGTPTAVGSHIIIQKDVPTATTTVPATPSAAPVSSPAQTVPPPVQPTAAMAGGGTGAAAAPRNPSPGAVQILEKKITHQTHPVGGVSFSAPAQQSLPKIIPHKKRLTSAPAAHTIKKPKFIIPRVAKSPDSLDTSQHKGETKEGLRPFSGATLNSANARGDKVGEGSKAPAATRRRFTERRIKIEVKPAVKTRKSRKLVKERIDTMPIQAVRRLLIKKGVLKAKATAPPEVMMRSMLHDYYLLKQSE
jgi:hypothetical protein